MDPDDKWLRSKSIMSGFVFFFVDLIEKPIVWFRETIVEPNRKEYYWYHEKLKRVPTVDECRTDDVVCIYEADCQFARDRLVDRNIVDILKFRYERCRIDFQEDPYECDYLYKKWQNAQDNFFIKYGDLGAYQKSIGCYMKQKHRMAWERRHGPVGSGMKSANNNSPSNEDLDK